MSADSATVYSGTAAVETAVVDGATVAGVTVAAAEGVVGTGELVPQTVLGQAWSANG